MTIRDPVLTTYKIKKALINMAITLILRMLTHACRDLEKKREKYSLLRRTKFLITKMFLLLIGVAPIRHHQYNYTQFVRQISGVDLHDLRRCSPKKIMTRWLIKYQMEVVEEIRRVRNLQGVINRVWTVNSLGKTTSQAIHR